MKRRSAIIAALLAPLNGYSAQSKTGTPGSFQFVKPDYSGEGSSLLYIGSMDLKPTDHFLIVEALGRKVTLTVQEVMDALEGK